MYNLKNITRKANDVRKLCLLNNALPSTDATVKKTTNNRSINSKFSSGQHYFKSAPVYYNRKSEITNTCGPQARFRPGHLLDMKQNSQPL